MEETAITNEQPSDAVAAYLAASGVALEAVQRLNDAWRLHFEAGGQAPSSMWIAEVAASQLASDMALDRARLATASDRGVMQDPAPGSITTPGTRSPRKRRREATFLAKLGKPTQRLLRGVVLLLLTLSTLVAVGAGISLALEIAGLLRLIEDPVQLPVGIQLATIVASAAAAFGLRRALKPVERALYGSKGVRPRGFQL